MRKSYVPLNVLRPLSNQAEAKPAKHSYAGAGAKPDDQTVEEDGTQPPKPKRHLFPPERYGGSRDTRCYVGPGT